MDKSQGAAGQGTEHQHIRPAGVNPRSASDVFPSDPTGLPEAIAPPLVELADGDSFELRVGPVAKRLADTRVRMLGYNGSIPGPTLKVSQGSEVAIHVRNDGDLDTTVHWHGLRLENKYDGVPHETQIPIPVGGDYTCQIRFPDPGLYWYHPHIREDYTQEMGLYGNVLVDPAEPDYWPPAHRDVVLTLDDVLLEDGKIASFSMSETSHTAMGRFGNVLLVSGETDLAITARAAEVMRLWLTNTANTRVFNVRLPGARMKLVGGDSGRMEHEEFVDEALLAPSERAVVDVLFERPGQLTLEHHSPQRDYPLASISVTDEPAKPSLREQFQALRHAPELATERQQLDAWQAAPPDKILALVAEMDDLATPLGSGPTAYACPMHPDVTSDQPGRCPTCGMKLLAVQQAKSGLSHDTSAMEHTEHAEHNHGGQEDAQGEMEQHPEHDHHRAHGHDHRGTERPPAPGARHGGGLGSAASDRADHDESHGHGVGDGIEWEDDMVDVNRLTTTANMHWKFVDRTGDAHSETIDWRFTVGDRVKIRLINEMDSDHPMHHPFHLHGAGRFLVLARDGIAERNLVWKDTVLIRTGQTVDILFDVTNPGLWMAHCHIAEHMQSGMMFSFNVDRTAA
jgi:FtsP/CotA-like multicopper oxidase with cupredoxin domain